MALRVARDEKTRRKISVAKIGITPTVTEKTLLGRIKTRAYLMGRPKPYMIELNKARQLFTQAQIEKAVEIRTLDRIAYDMIATRLGFEAKNGYALRLHVKQYLHDESDIVAEIKRRTADSNQRLRFGR